MNGPSLHLSWDELACWNRLGRSWNGIVPGGLVAVYPLHLRQGTALQLAETFEDIRAVLGHQPILINSAYRRPDYNQAVGGAKASQHVYGRALDIRHKTLTPRKLFTEIRELYAEGFLPHLGGIGLYKTFVHFDVRPRVTGRLAVWYGKGEGA